MSQQQVVHHVRAPRAAVYKALLDPRAVQAWRVPDDMTCLVHEFDPRPGGTFRVSLSYDDPGRAGKSAANTDTYTGHFGELVPDERVVEVIEFQTNDSAVAGPMTVTTTLSDADGGTDITVAFDGLPAGVSEADNEVGTRMSLDKLAALVERARRLGVTPGE
jgi:uncharacterized protein YndB with AHSA1/START domain